MKTKNDSPVRQSLKKFARSLLATTCLTVASVGAATATTVNEGTDFPDTSATAFVLPAGTDVVTGEVGTGDSDWVEFVGLLGGSNFSLTATASGFNLLELSVLSDGFATIFPPIGFFSGSPANLGPAPIPANGNLLVGVNFAGVEGSNNYTLTLTAAQQEVPEPATLGVVGLGLAGGFAWRRRQRGR